jgi:hypothetical protein
MNIDNAGVAAAAVQVASGLVADAANDRRLPDLARTIASDIVEAHGPEYQLAKRRARELKSPMTLAISHRLENGAVVRAFTLRPRSLTKVEAAPGTVMVTIDSDAQVAALTMRFASLAEVGNWIDGMERAQRPSFYAKADQLDRLKKRNAEQVMKAADVIKQPPPRALTSQYIEARFGPKMETIAAATNSLRFADANARARSMSPQQELSLLFSLDDSGGLVQRFALVPAYRLQRDPSQFEWLITPLRPGDESLLAVYESLEAVDLQTPGEVLDFKVVKAWLYTPPAEKAQAGPVMLSLEQGPTEEVVERDPRTDDVTRIVKRPLSPAAAETAFDAVRRARS